MFGTYLPPPTSLSSAVNIPAASRSTRVPQEVLTDAVVEDIKTRCCLVGDVLGNVRETREETLSEDAFSEADLPPSDNTQSGSDYSHVGPESIVSSQHESSEFSVVTNPRTLQVENPQSEEHLQSLSALYNRHSTATDLQMRVLPPPSQQTGTGRGTLLIPGWIRERAAEVLFEGGDVDESSLAEMILNALLKVFITSLNFARCLFVWKVPVDLRKTLASSILVSGGTAMLPGFMPRLHAELLRAIAAPPSSPRQLTRNNRPPLPQYDRYASLRPLISYFAILNNPSPPPPQSHRASVNAGKAPAFAPATLAWVGGSLAG